MDSRRGTQAMAATASTALAAGLAVVLYGTLRDDLARALGGTCVTLTALTVIALILIRRWIVDTSQERHDLAAATRKAEATHNHYLASQAALECEQTRLSRDMAHERQAIALTLTLERQKMQAEFASRRDSLVAETMEATVLMYRNGKFAPSAPAEGNLIHFPHQQRQAEQTRSREHGGVAP